MDSLKLHELGHDGFGSLTIRAAKTCDQRAQSFRGFVEMRFQNSDTLARSLLVQRRVILQYLHVMICL